MRLYPPSTALFTRVARRDLVIGETPVSKGTLVVVPIWHLHHDARSFAEPNTFRPDRFMPDAPAIPRSAYLPFGAGPHFCLGQHFATIEMARSAEHTSELQSLMRFSYAVFCLKKKNQHTHLYSQPHSIYTTNVN